MSELPWVPFACVASLWAVLLACLCGAVAGRALQRALRKIARGVRILAYRQTIRLKVLRNQPRPPPPLPMDLPRDSSGDSPTEASKLDRLLAEGGEMFYNNEETRE